jgi:hypothetical protein
LTPNRARRPFGCRSEALTKVFLLTLATRTFLEPEEIPMQVVWTISL